MCFIINNISDAMSPQFSAAINSHGNLASTLIRFVQILPRANTARGVFSFRAIKSRCVNLLPGQKRPYLLSLGPVLGHEVNFAGGSIIWTNKPSHKSSAPGYLLHGIDTKKAPFETKGSDICNVTERSRWLRYLNSTSIDRRLDWVMSSDCEFCQSEMNVHFSDSVSDTLQISFSFSLLSVRS